MCARANEVAISAKRVKTRHSNICRDEQGKLIFLKITLALCLHQLLLFQVGGGGVFEVKK